MLRLFIAGNFLFFYVMILSCSNLFRNSCRNKKDTPRPHALIFYLVRCLSVVYLQDVKSDAFAARHSSLGYMPPSWFSGRCFGYNEFAARHFKSGS